MPQTLILRFVDDQLLEKKGASLLLLLGVDCSQRALLPLLKTSRQLMKTVYHLVEIRQ